MGNTKELSKAKQRETFRADEKIRKATEGEWPKYAMASLLPGEPAERKFRKFYTFSQAAVLFDSGHVQVDFGVYVLYEDMSIRRMTDHDKHEISNAADEHSASK
jgi:hypothetical protein